MSKKVNELKQERKRLLLEQKELVTRAMDESRNMDAYEKAIFEELQEKERSNASQLLKAQEFEDRNKEEVMSIFSNKGFNISNDIFNKSNDNSFGDWVKNVVERHEKSPYIIEYRANPITTVTDSGVIDKIVVGIDQAITPAEALLRNLGVKFYQVNANLILPRLNESMAGWLNENADASTANLETTSITLSAKRVAHSQAITRELLSQTNEVYASVLQNLQNGIWKAVADRFFDDLETDTPGQVVQDYTVAKVNFTQLVNMEASLGTLDLIRPAYVMQPQTKAYLKSITKLANSQNSIWEKDIVNEYPAYASPQVNHERIHFGDFSKAVVAQFGPLEIIMDPFTQAAKGVLVFTTTGLFDMGIHNKNVFVTLLDASTY